MNEIIDNEFGKVKNFLSKYKNALMIVVLQSYFPLFIALNFITRKL